MDVPTAVQNFVTKLCECNGKETVTTIRDEYHRDVVKGVNAGTPKNAPKNPPVPGTGQIYASFIRTNTGVPFIASQAPTKHDMADYLNMLWENDVKLVVQLCKEDGRAKSYLSAASGHFKVEAERQSDGPDGLQRRTLKLTKEKCGTREIEHLLYSDWRDHCVPSLLEAFREIWRRVEAFHSAGQTVLAHCLGGRGRTGAFLSALSAYMQFRGNVDVDVIQVVRRVRAQRMYSVETSL
ncbi:Tyrosine-protein phosphatase non-receptor type 7, partial [Aphelenchoides avenae]